LPQGLPRAALLARMQDVIETESERLLPPGYAGLVDNSVG
jgi:1-acyl-sn-glycerol-3-phosphate acyltransferase